MRDRQHMRGGGAEREGDPESGAGSKLWAVSTEPDTGLEPTNHEIMTWTEVGRLTNWATRAPQFFLAFLKCIKYTCILYPVTPIWKFLSAVCSADSRSWCLVALGVFLFLIVSTCLLKLYQWEFLETWTEIIGPEGTAFASARFPELNQTWFTFR